MTNILPTTAKCALCQSTCEICILLSTNEFGIPDLDLRPPPMTRNTLPYRVFQCPHCGYAGLDLEDSADGDAAIVAEPEYQKLFKSSLLDVVKTYSCAALLEQGREHIDEAGALWLAAAWLCDDHDKDLLARECRSKAAACKRCALTDSDHFSDSEVLDRFVLIDVLRRARQFDDAKHLCLRLLDEKLADGAAFLIDYEISLIEDGDDQCHCVPTAPKEEG